MSDVLIPRRDLDFLLWQWLDLEQAGVDRETTGSILDLSASLAEDQFLTHYKAADQTEPKLDAEGNVHVHPAIHEALRQFTELGLFGVSFPEAQGGFGLHASVAAASTALFAAANVATYGYAMLTTANARVIASFGTPEQIEAFAMPGIEGRTFGTMCLSEPQAGSGLGDIRTRAVPDGDGPLGARYRLSGNKMWISGGDQDITANITHLVLAKVPGPDGSLPAGTKGISLFIVPKWLEGGVRNDVTVAGLNHKMGYRGTANCALNFGEGVYEPEGAPGAIGYRLGAEGEGLALMFQMMNEARIGVGLGAAALAYRAYRLAVQYAKERVQGRALSGGGGGPVAIIEHPDVQRMLLAQKCYAEGSLALLLYCSLLVEQAEHDEDAAELLALLTPVAKTWPSEWGLAANDLAIQVHGGYDYTRDFDVEQLYRDNRLNPIHEGTTGIQGLDLLGRKILRSNGRAFDLFARHLSDTVAAARSVDELAPHASALDAALSSLGETVAALRAAPDPLAALANATAFLSAFGHIVLAWIWLRQAIVAQALAAQGDCGEDDAHFYAGKLRACRFFFECELPKTQHWLAFTASLSDVAAGVPAECF